MTNKQKKPKWSKIDQLFLEIFSCIGVLGWFVVIWSDIYKFKLFFTCLLCLFLAIIGIHTKRDLEEKIAK